MLLKFPTSTRILFVTHRSIFSAILCLAIAFVPAIAISAERSSRPNIILILADDLGYSDLGCYGGEIATPNLDRLAANGLRFTSFYNSAKCEPTRASLISGQYWQDCGLGIKRGRTMGEEMQSAGYATFAVGKWHLDGNPVERGFDHYFGHLSGATDYFRGDNSFRTDDQPFRVPNNGSFYTTDANADYAIRFISDSLKKNPNKPFFTYLAFNAPHSPLQAWPVDIAKYRGKYLVGWDKLREKRYQRQLDIGIIKKEWAMSPRPETVPAWETLNEEEKEFEDARMAVYAAQVDRMDQAIGRILTKLRDLGQENNTLIVFLSDNGANPFDHGPLAARKTSALLNGNSHLGYGLGWANLSGTPFRHYKRNMFNGGSATPVIMHWPAGLQGTGRITDHPAHIIDLMATFVDLGEGIRPTASTRGEVTTLPGKSLRSIIEGKTLTPHEALYFQLFDHRAVIAGDWKLVSDWGRPWKLFNLAEDRTELHDLTSAHAKESTRLKALWDSWAEKSNVRLKPAGGEPAYRHFRDTTMEPIGGRDDVATDTSESD